jgi:tRNA nucleotidyltransferase (CCA-adding enzyme)
MEHRRRGDSPDNLLNTRLLSRTMFAFLEEVKKEILPDTEIQTEIDSFCDRLRSLLRHADLDATVMIGGSVGKGTFLRGNFDVDIFVRFSSRYESAALADLLAKALAPLHPIRMHGSRDYFQIQEQFLFEIVPVLAISSYKHAKNVTDMSPLHVEYVRSALKDHPQLADEIRLAKQFCKSIGVYGAESYIKGFSGHVLDLLIIHYGSFVNLLAAAEKWNERQVIDPSLLLDNPEKELNPAKRVSPLILVDPLQPDRNAAAALSKEQYVVFKKEAAAFLHHPLPSFFVVKHLDQQYLQERKATLGKQALLVVITVQPHLEKNDVAGAKVLKAFEFFRKQIKKDFSMLDANWEFQSDRAVLFAAVTKEELSEYEERQGPPLTSKKNYQEFLSKHHHQRVFVKNKRVYALVKRDARTFREIVKKTCSDPYFSERVKKIISIIYIE